MASAIFKLNTRELSLLPRVALELMLAELGLSALGIKRMLALLPASASLAPPNLTTADSMAQRARRLAWLVQGVSRRLPGSPRCLAQSLALRRLLARQGLSGQLIIGVRREAGSFDAHAWIEHCGEPLQPEPPAHQPIAAF